MAKVIWQAEMKISSVAAPSETGGAPVATLGLKGAIDGETIANLAWMMKAPWVRVTIEQVQGDLFAGGPDGDGAVR